MKNGNYILSMIEKCEIYYDDFIISSKSIMERYLSFFAEQLEKDEKTISFSFHTGAVCFDVVSVAAFALACFSYSLVSNDRIIETLQPGDMVLYNGERYRWCGVEKEDKGCGEQKYIILMQNAKGKNGPEKSFIPYDKNKHKVKPYYGESIVTDGRGVRKARSNRNEFLSYIMDVSEAEVPSTLDISFVIIADKSEIIDICQHLRFVYGEGKSIFLTDFVPVSYFSASGDSFQIGKNPAKEEAVIKLTSKVSEARNLVLSKSGNRVVGLWSANATSLMDSASGLNDLLRRKSLRFAHVSLPYDSESCEMAIEQYEDAFVFACTKELLEKDKRSDSNSDRNNPFLRELDLHINNIVRRKIEVVSVSGCWCWEEYKKLKNTLNTLRQSNWSGDDKDNFILSAMALMNLFTGAFFTMNEMERAIDEGLLSAAVVSPRKRLEELRVIAYRSYLLQPQCESIINNLSEMYQRLFEKSYKRDELNSILSANLGKRIAIIVPKAYYVDIFKKCFERFRGMSEIRCMTANRFDSGEEYDLIVACSDIVGKKFDSLQCYASPELKILLYDCERRMFHFRQKRNVNVERKLNSKMQGIKEPAYKNIIDNDSYESEEDVIREFRSLDEFVESLGLFDIRKLVSPSTTSTSYTGTAEVDFVGTFVTGEQILFSKYYSAVVFDQLEQSVSESSPDKLSPGDILVFTKRDDYTRNIVDMIFSQLLESNKIEPKIVNAAQKSLYWKEALRKYKEKNQLSYRALTRELRGLGSSLQEASVRQWLLPDSHIIRPKKEVTLHQIAELTQDPDLVVDPKSFFDAGSMVQHYRREIRRLIANAIHDKLCNKIPEPGSVFEIVFEHVERLSETKEIDSIYQLEQTENIPVNLVNRPIVETEVLL